MSEIVIMKDNDRWGAFVGEKRIATSGCRPCVVHAVLAVTKKSSKYHSIVVCNEDGTIARTIPTGDGNGRIAAKDL